MSYESNMSGSHLRNNKFLKHNSAIIKEEKEIVVIFLKRTWKAKAKTVADNRVLLKNFLTSKIKTKKVLARNQVVITDNSDFVFVFDK